MITITEQYIKEYKDKLDKIAKSFNLDKQKIIVEELTIKVSAPNFWDNFDNYFIYYTLVVRTVIDPTRTFLSK